MNDIFTTVFFLQGSTENGEYLQAWQFSTEPGRIVTAVRVADMGVFFLIIEINGKCFVGSPEYCSILKLLSILFCLFFL